MKRILVTAGGTATAWHIANIAKQYFQGKIEIQVCDTNEPYLVPCSILVEKVHKVAPVSSDTYIEGIREIVQSEIIECIIPLIPEEAHFFASDSRLISDLDIRTVVPASHTINMLVDKQKLFNTLSFLNIPSPKVFLINEIKEQEQYIIKPKMGFGSIGVRAVSGIKILENPEKYMSEELVVQEFCHDDDYDEVTVEVYNGRMGLHIFSRRRISTKAGVCVKMEPVDNALFIDYIRRIIDYVDCPIAFNVQFLRHAGMWKLFDCNLRLGAGTALSTAIGFQLTRALLAEIADDEINESFFHINPRVKSVLRAWQEIVIE